MLKYEVAISISNVTKIFRPPRFAGSNLKNLFIHPSQVLGQKKSTPITVLQDINLNIRKGEFFGIVGRNGGGKSTLLKLIAQIYAPTKGSVNVKGLIVPFIELGVGFHGELSGYENVYMNGALLGFSRASITAKMEAIVKFAELEGHMDKPLKNFSSGMQVRLAFSIASMTDADILLVDEVLAVGDLDFQQKCFRHFELLKRVGKTVVFVTHDMGAVEQFCDRAILIDQGRITHEGMPRDVAREYRKLFSNSEAAIASIPASGERPDMQTVNPFRFGNGDVKFTALEADATTYSAERGGIITVRAQLAANHAVAELVTGICIKNELKQPLFGTNTQLEDSTLANVKAGETIEITWSIPNILENGAHWIEVTAHSKNSLTIYDWWDLAIKINIIRTRRTPFYVHPDIALKLTRHDGK